MESAMNRRQTAFVAGLLWTITAGSVLAAIDQTMSAPAPSAGKASASTTAVGAQRTRRTPDDQVICETIEEIGSRLGDRKVCLTRAAWRHQSNVRGGMQTMVVGGCQNDVKLNAKC
jgi:hypothetical protein